MKNAVASARQLEGLMKRVGKMRVDPFPQQGDVVSLLVYSFFLWESTTTAAQATWQNFRDGFVDENEFRVTLPHEMAGSLVLRDSRALDRCRRVRAVLNDIYRRERHVSLDRLRSDGKREARKYLDSLEGMVPYVSARVALIAFDTHALPVDEQLRALLLEEGVGDEGVDVVEMSSWLSRQVKASEARSVHDALQAWCDAAAAKIQKVTAMSRPRSTGRGSGKKASGSSRRAKKA